MIYCDGAGVSRERVGVGLADQVVSKPPPDWLSKHMLNNLICTQ